MCDLEMGCLERIALEKLPVLSPPQNPKWIPPAFCSRQAVQNCSLAQGAAPAQQA